MIPAFALSLSKWIGITTTSNSLRRLCYYCAIASVAIFFCACQASTSKSVNGSKDSTTVLNLPAPSPISKADSIRIHNACAGWYDTALNINGFNGGMIVAYKGNIVFERYNGTIHLPGKDTITASTPMQVASTSKTFTAMGVLKLWQDGKLSIDDEYSKYFPEFNYPGVTIRSLLNHRSGLPNYIYFMENLGWDKTKFVTNEDVLNYLITRKADLENVATPDTHFSYSNTNYALLALLIEKVSGKKLPAFLKETFFLPLQMNNTFVYGLADTAKMTPSYDWRERIMPLNFLDPVYGDKNVYTTPHDLLQWDRGLNSGLIFKPETLQQAYAPYSNEKAGTKNYGLGWRMTLYPEGKKIIFHNGWWHGCNAAFIRLLQDSATIILISNKFNRAVYHSKVLANIFGEYYNTGEEEEAENAKSTDSSGFTRVDNHTLINSGSFSVKKKIHIPTPNKRSAAVKSPHKKTARSKKRRR